MCFLYIPLRALEIHCIPSKNKNTNLTKKVKFRWSEESILLYCKTTGKIKVKKYMLN